MQNCVPPLLLILPSHVVFVLFVFFFFVILSLFVIVSWFMILFLFVCICHFVIICHWPAKIKRPAKLSSSSSFDLAKAKLYFAVRFEQRTSSQLRNIPDKKHLKIPLHIFLLLKVVTVALTFILLGQWHWISHFVNILPGQRLSCHLLHSFPEDWIPVLLGFFIPYQLVSEKHNLVLKDPTQRCQYLASKLERPPRKREGKILKIELGASVVVVVVAVEIRRDKTVVGGKAGELSG